MKTTMKQRPIQARLIRVAVVESDALRATGFRTLLEEHNDLKLSLVSVSEIQGLSDIDVALLGHKHRDSLQILRTTRPGLHIIVTGCYMDDKEILDFILHGAKGCIDESSCVDDLAQAIRAVSSGSIWVQRRVLSMLLDKACGWESHPVSKTTFTTREKEVLGMLAEGRSNKEIASPMGIEVRTVKAYISKLLRKVGVSNRIKLSVHAATHGPELFCREPVSNGEL